jgi:hypothetical protein
VAHGGGKICADFVRKALRNLQVLRPKMRWEDSITMYVVEIAVEDGKCMELTRDRVEL